MSKFIADPRRAPRVTIELPVAVTYESRSWKAVALDIGPGGCQLDSAPPLAERARVVVALRSAAIPEPLEVSATIAWLRGGRCGIAFITGHRGSDPGAWFQRLLATHPELKVQATRTPTHLHVDAQLSKVSSIEPAAPLNADEQRVLSLVEERTPAHVVALHANIPPFYFARALFGLLAKGVVVVPQERSEAPASRRVVSLAHRRSVKVRSS